MKREVQIGLVCIALGASAAVLGQSLTDPGGEVPQTIPYQGFLEANGVPIERPDGNGIDMTFRLIDSTDTLQHEEVIADVVVTGGRFAVALGAGGLGDGVYDADELWLEIQLEGSATPLTPRQRIIAVPLARKSQVAAHAVEAESAVGALDTRLNDLVPVGSITAYWGTSSPPGWLLCDGASVPPGAEFDALRSLVGNAVPDLRDYFLRGASGSRPPGNIQGDSTRVRLNGANGAGLGGAPHGSGAFVSDNAGQKYTYSTQSPTWPKRDASDAFDNTYGNAPETRPVNISVNFIIKY
jgi:hypothetical protein